MRVRAEAAGCSGRGGVGEFRFALDTKHQPTAGISESVPQADHRNGTDPADAPSTGCYLISWPTRSIIGFGVA
jgi:hypothetical protein